MRLRLSPGRWLRLQNRRLQRPWPRRRSRRRLQPRRGWMKLRLCLPLPSRQNPPNQLRALPPLQSLRLLPPPKRPRLRTCRRRCFVPLVARAQPSVPVSLVHVLDSLRAARARLAVPVAQARVPVSVRAARAPAWALVARPAAVPAGGLIFPRRRLKFNSNRRNMPSNVPPPLEKNPNAVISPGDGKRAIRGTLTSGSGVVGRLLARSTSLPGTSNRF